ncbi:hypothetical protein SORBI_3010G233450 [Sorghum bicolor]|uniref:Uncharacterized protein n=1 Tax=Sorghum bicolor TaxID=4558 RepID=A0A1W0VUG2_SORBI|nr:hypothetical protein SORBI_3010G233450 [Sorghum bicolor]
MNHKHFYCFLNPPLAVGPRHVPSRPAAAPMPPPCHHLLRGHRVGCAIAGRVGSPRALTRSGTGLLLNPSCGVAAASDYKVGIDDDDFEALAHRMQLTSGGNCGARRMGGPCLARLLPFGLCVKDSCLRVLIKQKCPRSRVQTWLFSASQSLAI